MERQDQQDRGAGALTSDAKPIETEALIIGAGPVGLFQAFQLGLLEISSHIVDALPHAGGQCVELYGDKPIYDIPGTPRTTGRGLVESLMAQVAPFKPSYHLGTQVSTLARQEDGRWSASTSTGVSFLARTVFIAAGVGAFVPKRLNVEGLEALEGASVFYHPDSLERFAGRSVVVNGGDDAALDVVLTLLRSDPAPARVTLMHRRDVFQGSEEKIAEMRAAIASGRLDLLIAQVSAFDGQALKVATPDGHIETRKTDALIVCHGISPKLGSIAEWGLELVRKQLPVDTERFQTAQSGLFAVGDINTYPGKKKLIVCGFHEATLAAWGASELVFPGKSIPLQYTTTSTRLHTLLGV